MLSVVCGCPHSAIGEIACTMGGDRISAHFSIRKLTFPAHLPRHNLTVGQVSLVLPQLDTQQTVLKTGCPTPLPPSSCPVSRYRTLDGTCNNVDQPRWGAANTPYLRLLPAWYRDGESPKWYIPSKINDTPKGVRYQKNCRTP